MSLGDITAPSRKSAYKPWAKQESEYLLSNWGAISPDDMAKELGRTRLGVLAHAKRFHGLSYDSSKRRRPPAEVTRPTDGRESQAANYLQRIAPCYHCDVSGRYDPKGNYWRFGSLIYTPAELIARAERAGWRADSWKDLGL